MSLIKDVTAEINASLKAGDKLRTSTLRLLLSALKNKEIELRRTLEDGEAHQVVSTLIRQRHESIEQFEKGGRADLAEKEAREIEILKPFLPPQMSEEEITGLVKKAAEEAGASTMKDMGKLMKILMPRVKGKADGKVVNEIVRKVLGG